MPHTHALTTLNLRQAFERQVSTTSRQAVRTLANSVGLSATQRSFMKQGHKVIHAKKTQDLPAGCTTGRMSAAGQPCP